MSHYFFLVLTATSHNVSSFSHLPLSKLASRVVDKLQECHSKSWPLVAVTSKIKLLAKRKSYLDAATSGAAVDLFEDETEDRMWRWEIISMDILPTDVTAKVRKARSARNKLRSHVVATLKLVDSLRSAESVIGDTSLPSLDTVLAKISRDEEKTLKYEREAEKPRLAQQAKRKKQQELDAKKKEKEQATEEKRKEKERKKQEAEEKKLEVEKQKQETTEARQEAKRKKTQEKEEREEQKKKEIQQKEGALKKQQGMLMSFFAAPPAEKAPKVESVSKPSDSVAPTEAAESSISSGDFDVDKFRSLIDSEEKPVPGRKMFPRLSPQAIASRKRRTREVAVSVYVTVMPDGNAFDAQPFAEQQVIKVPNKYRFLSFHEDRRPAYHGTWSRTSSVISGRNPFGKDNTDLDYDVDSEGEWEEGDDEIGEDVDDDDKNQEEDMEDEEGDPSNYNYQDGFCVADEEYLAMDEDADEETRLLYKKKLQTGQGDNADKPPNAAVQNTICIVAPSMGGLPRSNDDGEAIFEGIEGFEKQAGLDIVASHAGLRLMDIALCLDAFPPALTDEGDAAGDATSPAPNSNSAKQEDYSDEEVKLLARFVHHCILDSKAKLIEELKVLHPTVFTTRAKATRKLDSIATKKRRKTTGVYWEVKKEVLEELGLHDVLVSSFHIIHINR
jgi:chromatin assembly factor 1 subunit A